MFDIDECGETAPLLCLRNDREGERRLARGFRTEHFDNPAAWKSTNAKRAINQNVAGGNDVDIDDLLVAKSHNRTFAVILGNLLNRKVEVLISCGSQFVRAGFLFRFRRHIKISLITSLAAIRQAEKLNR